MPLSVDKLRPDRLKPEPPKKPRRFFRKLLWAAGVFFALLVVAYFVVTSKAFIKAFVMPKVATALNAAIAVTDVEFSPFSQLVLRDAKVTPRDTQPLLSAGVVRARYSLFALLRGRIVVEEFTVESPSVTIVENADGTSNLDPLLKHEQAAKGTAPPPAKPAAPPQVDVKLVSLKNATIQRTKHLKGGGTEVMELANVNLTVANIRNGSPGKLDLSAGLALESSKPGGVGSLQANITGNLTFGLTQDLKPARLNGKTEFAIGKATGVFADAASLSALLDCDATPTEVNQVSLRFTQAGAPLGELRVSGPLNAEKSEGKLSVVLSSLDRRVLNLFGASSGLDFGTTTVSSSNVVELTKAGSAITVSGQLDAARMAITRQKQTTPTLGFRCEYSVTVDRGAESATLSSLNLSGTQNEQSLLKAELTSPMTVAWGNTSSAVGDAALNLGITKLNLSDWQAFAPDLGLGGVANVTLKLLSKQAGKQLLFDLDGAVADLSAKLGDKSLSHVETRLAAKGSGMDLKQFKLDEYRVEVAQQNQPALTVSGSGTFDAATQDADLQVVVQATLARLLALLPQPDANFSAGTFDLKGRVTNKKEGRSIAGQLVLADLRGRYGNYRFADFGSAVDLDVAMSAKQMEIRKASGSVREGTKPGGNFDANGKLDFGQAHVAGHVDVKLTDFNENGLRPFLESAMADKKLVSVTLNTTAAADLQANGDASAKADLKLANLVVSDPRGSMPSTPLEARAQFDAGVAKSVAQIRQCQLTLTPTARAKNELTLTGTVDYSKSNAITGSLKLASDALDVTRYYELFGEKPKAVETGKPAATNPPPATANVEPDAIPLPFRNFTFGTSLGHFYLRDVDAANIQAVATLDAGRVLLKPCQFTLNGAPVSATADLDLSVPGYKYDLTFSADRVPVEPLANAFSPTYRGQAQGALIASAQIKGAGITGRSLQKSLTGTVNFSFTNANIQIAGPKLKAVLTPIAFVLGEQELLRSPLDYVNADLRAGNGQIQVVSFVAHSAAFLAESSGVIPIADVLMDSPLNQDVGVSLARNLASKLRFSNVPADVAYMKLPTFVHLRGTLGAIDTKTDKAVITGLTLSGVGGAIGGKPGAIIQGIGGLLGGARPAEPENNPATQPPNATNAPATNRTQRPFNPFDLFKKP